MIATPPSRTQAIGATLLASLLWGSSFVINKVGLDRGLDPCLFTMLRMSFAVVLMALVLAFLRQLASVTRWLLDWRAIVLGVANAGGFLLQYLGQDLVPASHAALLANAGLPLVAVLGWLFLRESLGWLQVLAVLIALGGAVVITLLQPGSGSKAVGGTVLWGDLLMFLSSLAWAVFFIINRRLMQQQPQELFAVTGAMYAWTVVLVIPATMLLRHKSGPDNATDWLIVGYTALFCSVVPYLLWSHGLKTVAVATSSVLLVLEILFAVVLSAALLGDPILWNMVVGGALILAAAVLVSLPAGKEAARRSLA